METIEKIVRKMVYLKTCVEKVENGYFITISKYGRNEKEKDSEYIDECKKFISETNPLENNESDKKDSNIKSVVSSALNSINDFLI
jgi:hypothetical protein